MFPLELTSYSIQNFPDDLVTICVSKKQHENISCFRFFTSFVTFCTVSDCGNGVRVESNNNNYARQCRCECWGYEYNKIRLLFKSEEKMFHKNNRMWNSERKFWLQFWNDSKTPENVTENKVRFLFFFWIWLFLSALTFIIETKFN